MTERKYLAGVPQATEREREWARGMATLIVHMVQQHGGTVPDGDDLAGDIAQELRAAVALLNASS